MARGGAHERRFVRQRRRLRVTWAGHSPVFTVDVSAGGFCVEAMRVLAPNQKVEGTLEVQGKTFRYTGVVKWAKASEPALQLRGRMGVQFTHVDEGCLALLGLVAQAG